MLFFSLLMTPKFIQLVTGWMLMGCILLSSAFGTVLCVDQDGHFTVKPTYHDHGVSPLDADACAHPDADRSGEVATLHSTGGCNDILLHIRIDSLVAKDLQSTRLLMSELISLMPTGYDAASAFNAAYGRQNSSDTAMLRISPSILEKRTIVLRN